MQRVYSARPKVSKSFYELRAAENIRCWFLCQPHCFTISTLASFTGLSCFLNGNNVYSLIKCADYCVFKKIKSNHF